MNSRAGALTGFGVLVVDDDVDNRELLGLTARYFGASVTTASDAASAIETLRHIVPDVVITRMFLPDHDAGWLVREIRTHGHDTPVITVWPVGFDGLHLEPDGFSALLRPPIHHTALVDAILAAVRSRGA